MRSIPRTRFLLLSAAMAAVAAAGARAAPALGANSAVPQCRTAQLRLKFVDMQAGTSHRYIDYALENVGATRCSLRGYPGAALVDNHGHPIRSANAKVSRWALTPTRTLVINPKRRLFFTFTWVVSAPCVGHSFTFYGLRVVPPQNASGFAWHLGRTPTCDNSARISAVRSKLLPG